MRTRAPGSSHENCCFMGQFRKFMTIQPIFDATELDRRPNESCAFLTGILFYATQTTRAATNRGT